MCFEIVIKGVDKKYAIAIECKMDTTFKKGQLATHTKRFENYYQKPIRKGKFETMYFYLVGRNDKKPWRGEVAECDNNNFKFMTVCELKRAFGNNPELTGDTLFDKFWFEYYDCGTNKLS